MRALVAGAVGVSGSSLALAGLVSHTAVAPEADPCGLAATSACDEVRLTALNPNQRVEPPHGVVVVPESEATPADSKPDTPKAFRVEWPVTPHEAVNWDKLGGNRQQLLLSAILKGVSLDEEQEVRVKGLEQAVVDAIEAGLPPLVIRQALLNTSLVVATRSENLNSEITFRAPALLIQCPQAKLCARFVGPELPDPRAEFTILHLFYGLPKIGEPLEGVNVPSHTIPSGTTYLRGVPTEDRSVLHVDDTWLNLRDGARATGLDNAYPPDEESPLLFRLELEPDGAGNTRAVVKFLP